jgi:fructose-bisphosphate aldolase class II
MTKNQEYFLLRIMKTLREILADVDSKRIAIGHFNISDLATLKGIFSAAQNLSAIRNPQSASPILIGTSEGEREFIGVREAAVLVKSLREQYDYPIFLNADHTHSLEKVKEAAEAGYDEILFDGSALPFEENIAQTKQAVLIVRGIDPSIVVEGEIGYIGSNSEIINERPENSLKLSTPEEAVQFVKETGVDVLAPAVGNMHGLLKGMVEGLDQKIFSSRDPMVSSEARNDDEGVSAPAIRRGGMTKPEPEPLGRSRKGASGLAPQGTEFKHLDIALIGEIKKACGVYMTLHGGSGTADEDFVGAIQAGMNIVHISSELRLAWRRGIEAALADQNEIAPYKLLAGSVSGIEMIVTNRLKLFNGLS